MHRLNTDGFLLDLCSPVGVYITTSKDPFVWFRCQPKRPLPELCPDSGYRVQQDDEHCRYALVYNDLGIVTTLIDVRGHRVARLSRKRGTTSGSASKKQCLPEEPHLKIVGLSGGVVGVWKYSPEYLAAESLQQTGQELSKKVLSVFKRRR